MTREQLLLTQIVEECNEVSKRVTKALRFGLLETQPGQTFTNKERIIEELHDLVAVLGMTDTDFLNMNPNMLSAKRKKVENYLEYSRTQGCLTEG